jgi:serine/threonine protein kinase
MSEVEASHEEDLLAEEMRAAFGLGPDASGFEVDLSAPRGPGVGSSAPFAGFASQSRYRRGSLLGDFEILAELGRGGMGVVYRARQVSLGREVALKVLPDYAHRGPMAIQRFRNEARAAARLQHTNIVPIYAQGEDHGTFFYAMELVAGASLDAAIRDRTRFLSPSNPSLSIRPTTVTPTARAAETAELIRDYPPPNTEIGPIGHIGPIDRVMPPLPLDARNLRRIRQDYCHLARLLAEVADGLEHAHRAGVIHRDIKPQNLLVGADERLHITDFGLARLADAESITLTGEVMGTPAYLSPEQVRADQPAIDGRTDIYSLGVTLYELLTLRRPFQGETREQLLTGIREREPQPPRTFDEHIPKDLQTICLKAMEKEPVRRYATAAAMAEDLRRFADGRPILSRPAGPVTKAVKWARRHKAASAAIAASTLVLLLSAGLAASVVSARHREADALVDGVYNRLVYYDYRATDEQLADLDRAAELGGDASSIEMLRALAKLFDRGDPSQRKAARTMLDELVAADPLNADFRYLHAVALDRSGAFDEAAEAIAAADELAGATSAGWFFRGLALHYRDAAEAIRSYEQANNLRAQAGDVFLHATLHLARARNQRMYAMRTIDDLGAIVRPLEQIVNFDLYGTHPYELLSIAHRLAAEVYTGSAGARDSEQLAEEHYAQAVHWAHEGQQVDPSNALCFLAEAMARQSMGSFDSAIAALNGGELAANGRRDLSCEILHYRWRLHYWLGNDEAAERDIAAYGGCASLEAPFYAHFYPMLLYAERGELDQARAAAYALSSDASTNALAVIWTASALRVLGDEGAAQAHLRDHADAAAGATGEIPQQTTAWIHALYRTAQGELPLADLLLLAEGADQPWRLTGEAEFHAAAMALTAGDRSAALEGFMRAWRCYDSATRYTYHGELIARKMQADPQWPAWIAR